MMLVGTKKDLDRGMLPSEPQKKASDWGVKWIEVSVRGSLRFSLVPVPEALGRRRLS